MNKYILAVGITILFLGVAVVPIICGYNNKSNVQLVKENPFGFPLNDDFINAYWRFDECSGDTVGDSSGHNYNGIRYGATWTTDGYSGCALDFDGLDDYVDLTDHVAELAVNKTDDFIISFYFKSTSNTSGIILSLTGNQNNPEFRLELCSNGSLLFKIGFDLCQIVLFSDEGYNDGSWHNVYIIFNGITTLPTVEIYIDDNLDVSLTDWVCDFENTDFLEAAIGKKASDDLNFFRGQIDELKFIKYEGGNQQPTLEINGSSNGQPYHEYVLTIIINDSEGDDGWIKIDWDDGNITDWLGPYKSGETVNVSHEYIEDGRYEIRAKSKDFWDESSWSEPFVVRIGDYPLFPPSINGPRYGKIDVLYNYKFVADNFEGNDLFYFIDWGDGNITEWLGPYPSGQEITISHSWLENGTYAIIAKVRDFYRESDWSEPYFVKIGDYENLKINIDGPTIGRPGITYYYNFSIDEDDGDYSSIEIDWDDGTQQVESYKPGQNITVGHCWEEKGTYVIRAKAEDIWGGVVWGELKVTIPRVRISVNLLLLRLLERFPLLERLLGLIKNF